MAQRVNSFRASSPIVNVGRSKVSTRYDVVCRKRIRKIKKMQDEQFKAEIKKLEAMQQSAYDQIRFHRFFAITTLWPPLHNRNEIENTIRGFYAKPQKHFRRINFMLENGVA